MCWVFYSIELVIIFGIVVKNLKFVYFEKKKKTNLLNHTCKKRLNLTNNKRKKNRINSNAIKKNSWINERKIIKNWKEIFVESLGAKINY